MSATTSEAGVPAAKVAFLVACVLAAVGAGRLTLDEGAAFRLPANDPVERADRALREGTGGDDLIAVVLSDSRGALAADTIDAADALLEALKAEPALARSRGVTRAPILDSVGGALTATTPLHPTPVDVPSALGKVLADPFAVGTLITPDGTRALLPSWVARRDADDALVAIAGKALADKELRATELGKACGDAVNAARLAVVLGDAPGPAGAEVARRLRALAAGGNSLAAEWDERASRLAEHPEEEAALAVQRAVDAVALPDGVTASLLGEVPLRTELGRRFPLGVALLVGGVLLGLALFSEGRGRVRAPALGGLGALAVAGGMGWAGAPLHSQTALWIPLAAGLVGVASERTGQLRAGMAAVLPMLGLALGAGGVPGMIPAGLFCCAVALLTGPSVGQGSEDPAQPEGAPFEGAGRLAAIGLALAGIGLAATQPLGLDPSRQLDSRTATGRVTAALAEDGMGSPAQLALDGGAPRALADPERLRALRQAQDALEADEAVLASVSWADFVAHLHRAVSGGSGLPSDPALVDQYLLLFGRPDDVRPLVAPDFRVGGGLVRLAPDQGAALGRLAGPVGDTGAVLTGGAARVARAGWLTARRGGLGAVCAAALSLLILVVSPNGRGPGLRALASASVAVAACGVWMGATGFEAVLAGAATWALSLLAPGRMRWSGLGAGLALLSPVVPVAGLGVGVAAGALAAGLIGRAAGTVRAR